MAVRALVVAICCGVVLAVGAAHAASVGGVTTASLTSLSSATTVPRPSVLGCDNFTGTTGADIAGRAATAAARCANRVWSVHVGAWSIQSNRAASTGVAGAVLTQNTAGVDSSAQVVLTSLNTGGRSGGVVLAHDGVDSYLSVRLVDGSPDRVEVAVVDAAGVTIVASTPVTLLTTNTLRATRAAGQVTVTLNGVDVVTHVLTSDQAVTLGTGARAGLIGPNASVRFDDFVVTAP